MDSFNNQTINVSESHIFTLWCQRKSEKHLAFVHIEYARLKSGSLWRRVAGWIPWPSGIKSVCACPVTLSFALEKNSKPSAAEELLRETQVTLYSAVLALLLGPGTSQLRMLRLRNKIAFYSLTISSQTRFYVDIFGSSRKLLMVWINEILNQNHSGGQQFNHPHCIFGELICNTVKNSGRWMYVELFLII